MRLSVTLLSSCLVVVIFSLGVFCTEVAAREKKPKSKKGTKDPATLRKELEDKVRKHLGEEEEGYFVVALKKTYYQPTKSVRQPNGNSYKVVRAPRGRPFAILSYNVSVKKGREATVDSVVLHLMKFRPDISGNLPESQPAPGMPMSTTDFKFIGRYDEETKAKVIQRKAKRVYDERAKASR